MKTYDEKTFSKGEYVIFKKGEVKEDSILQVFVDEENIKLVWYSNTSDMIFHFNYFQEWEYELWSDILLNARKNKETWNEEKESFIYTNFC